MALRSLIEKAEVQRRLLAVKEIEWRGPAGETRWLDLQVAPLINPGGAILGTVLTFIDVTAYRRLQRELEQSLQELETANEELQSTNEELQPMNDELRQRGDDLNSANSFLQSVLTSLRGGVAVVDRELRVLAWNVRAEDLWGLRESEVNGEHLLNLDIGLPVDRLKPLLRNCLHGETEAEVLTLDAVNRRGKPIRCEVTCAPLKGAEGEVRGAIVTMQETADGKG